MTWNWTDMLKAFMVLFAVIDIAGSIPVILQIKKKAGDIHALKASIVAYGTLLLFFFFGEELIGLFGITVKEFAVAGAFVLFFLALEMILGIDFFKQDEKEMKSASIVPVAFPLIAGAGSMTSIIALQAEVETQYILISITANMIIVFVVLKLTNKIEHLLGDVGIAILKKVFGIILLAIAVKLFSVNLSEILN